ncbi:MAG: MotA/TolQ/ExbB proton channel family protein, partial [Flammeovirgaceae bacterium]|nr:MotA/TolQ/ExbB proton channel family protein [Flammeovirgaceae bacterium]
MQHDFMLFVLQEPILSEGMTNATQPEKIYLIDLLIKGGWSMIPIAILFLVAVYIFIERFTTYQKARKPPLQLLSNVKEAMLRNDLKAANKYCELEKTPMAKMLKNGLEHIYEGSPELIEAAVQNAGKIEIYYLEKNLSWLGTISGAAPMLGFFGTVLGMIKSFMAMANEEGAISAKTLSSGIYEAMITTAAGLFVGILAYV